MMKRKIYILPIHLYSSRNSPLSLFSEHNNGIVLSQGDALDPLALAMVAPTLLFFKIESGEGVALYNPQKVMT